MNPTSPLDADLVQAALAGNREAFGQLVTRHQDRLFNSLVRITGSYDDAADVLQDAFLQAFLKLQSFRGASKFSTWLYRVAMNVAFSKQRRRRTTVSLDQTKESLGAEPACLDDRPEEAMLSRERVEQVQAALADLGDEHRQILVLREIDGFAYEEIAEILDLPVGTVRSRIFRARGQLKEKLAGVVSGEW